MPANIPNLGAISTVGSQFTQNVFEKGHKLVQRRGKEHQEAVNKAAKEHQKARDNWAKGVNQAVKEGQRQAAQNAKQQAQRASQAQKAHAAGVKSGRMAPGAGSPPRTFSMGTIPAQKMSPEDRTMRSQRNFAHGQAIMEQNRRDRASARAEKPATPKQTTAKPATPYQPAQRPVGASNKPLPNASAAHSSPGKPQTIFQGAYTHKPGGIAAAGSRLEAWAQTKQTQVQKRRASGGRSATPPSVPQTKIEE